MSKPNRVERQGGAGRPSPKRMDTRGTATQPHRLRSGRPQTCQWQRQQRATKRMARRGPPARSTDLGAVEGQWPVGGMADGQVPAQTQWVSRGREGERGQQGRRRGARKAAELERASARFQWKCGRSQNSSRIHGKTLAFQTRAIHAARFRTARDSRHPIQVDPIPKLARFAPPDLARQEMRSPAVAAAKLQGVPLFRTPCRNAFPGWTDGTTDGGPTDGRTSPRHQWRQDGRTY